MKGNCVHNSWEITPLGGYLAPKVISWEVTCREVELPNKISFQLPVSYPSGYNSTPNQTRPKRRLHNFCPQEILSF
ncbi:hypothetical protein Sjap_019444 [Stephania japonica]|uniref:Uncharacterized protein n=1 Tax=Stephania japonica TaxID=461633 RepID=A0AAP0EYS7_9MAGN